MTEVVIKGEIHTSESDLAEERELLVEGIDALVLEGEREDAEYGLLRSWYATAMFIVGLILFETLYSDHRILVDLADAQEAEVYATRESDAELVKNANPLVEVVAAVLFYGIFTVSVFWGLFTGDTLGGAVLLLAAAILPVFVLRVHDMERSDDEVNRDQIMANKIVEAAEGADRVVAIVGGKHLDGVVSKLPEEVNAETKKPAYKMYSWQHAKEVAIPAFTALSVLFVLYLLVLEVFQWALLHA
ncbi:hypothetical protein [Halovivax gelatinilyticus]|uniref:hypothetical protein n=1 Tax=Halovivax gelatinilyticus TaxID=2961597 RepID=UPI0020CA8D83|nr:hypothetical protein [Halovivax gelatinilyticus]